MTDSQLRRNRFMFSVGTSGRDMQYTLLANFLSYYLTEILDLPDATLWWTTAITLIVRVWDAVNDPMMGFFVDNTKTRFGKFKPWIAAGALLSILFTILFFTDFGLRGTAYIMAFAVFYLLWEVTYSANDIAYWSMMPSLSLDQKEREKIGSLSRIFANIGLFVTVVAIIPVTGLLGKATGSMTTGFLIFAVAVGLFSLLTQSFTVFGVVEQAAAFKPEKQTTLREFIQAIAKNDQLLCVAFSMGLFMVGYCTTANFGPYYFKYAYGEENMYSIFAAVLGVAQLAALLVFPLLSRRFKRRQLFQGATALVVVGYIIFFFAPMNILIIGAAGIPIFFGQAFIQLLMLMFLADTIEYGQWKLGRRNESVTFSVQPFINKVGGALGTAVVSATVIISGISRADQDPAAVGEAALWQMKVSMLIVPLLLILASYAIWAWKFKIDKPLYDKIVAELKERGDLARDVR